MTEGLKKQGLARQPSCVLVPSDSRQCQVWGGTGKGEAAEQHGFVNSPQLSGGRCFWNPEQSGYLVSLGNLGAEPARMQEALPGEKKAVPAC